MSNKQAIIANLGVNVLEAKIVSKRFNGQKKVCCLTVTHKRQDVANHQPFGEGQGQVLVLAEAKTLPHPFVEGLVPGDGSSDRAGGFGFFSHASMMATGG